jgi:hypothetical protein
VTRCALKLAPLVFVRPGELRKAEWSEIDLDAGEWRIPAAKMKVREPHIVPLSRQAVAILREVYPLTRYMQYVFPGTRSRRRPMSENTINAALRRLGSAAAQDLYDSALFRGRRAFVEATCDRWFVLSAKHGLVSPTEILERYEETLNAKSMTAKRGWAVSVLQQLDRLGFLYTDTVFEIHAGAAYRKFGLADGLRTRGAAVVVPAEHLGQGKQLASYARTLMPQTPPPTTGVAAFFPSSHGARSSYALLADHLRAANVPFMQLSFSEIEQILGRPLPASARRHRAWWSNDASGRHSHAAAWMDAGWLVETVDLGAGTARFRKGHR